METNLILEKGVKIIILIAFMFAILVPGIPYFYNTFFTHQNDQKTVIFNVTGIVNATNSSIISIQYECIKYCIDKYGDYGQSSTECWKECDKLGGCK